MHTLFSLALAVLTSMVLAAPTHAAGTITVDVRVETTDLTVTETVYLTDSGCSVVDSTQVERSLPRYAALCALQRLADQKGWTLGIGYYDGFGVFLNSIDTGTENYVGGSENYWLYYVNNREASLGIGNYELENNDELLLSFGGYALPLELTLDRNQRRAGSAVNLQLGYYVTDYTTGEASYTALPDTAIVIGESTVTTDETGAAQFVPQVAGEYQITAEVDGFTRSATATLMAYDRHTKYRSLGRKNRKAFVQAAKQYIVSQIDVDTGVVGGNMVNTEWAAMALKAAGADGTKATALYSAVLTYQPTSGDGTSALARHILAIEAIDGKKQVVRSTNVDGKNYVKRLLATFDTDTNQFGDEDLCNDDVFAVLALVAAGEPFSTPELAAAVEHTYNCQTEDGFSYAVGGSTDTDTTAAWLMMANRIKGHKGEHGVSGLKSRRKLATRFFRDNQNPDGGWGYNGAAYSNSGSTAWVAMALRSRGHYANAMRTNKQHAFHYLFDQQRSSGAVRYDSFGSQSDELYNAIHGILGMKVRAFPTHKRIQL